MEENIIAGDATKNGKATAGLVLGIIGMVAWLLPIAGAPVTIIGLIFGIIGLKSAKRGVAVAGIVLSSIGLLLTIISAFLGVYFMKTFSIDGNSKTSMINLAVEGVKKEMPVPYKLDDVTTLANVTAESDAIRYHYVLSDIDANKITNDLLKNSIMANICQDMDTKNLLNQDINMEFSYSVEKSSQKYFVSITKTDCKL